MSIPGRVTRTTAPLIRIIGSRNVTCTCDLAVRDRKGRIGIERYSVRHSIRRRFTPYEPPRAFRCRGEIIASKRKSKRRWVGRLDRQSVVGHGAVYRIKSGCEGCAFVTDPFYLRHGGMLELTPFSLASADMHLFAWAVDIAHLQGQCFSQAQAHRVRRQQKYPVT
jgi:hypothetical protein